jgi:hypothetical protein
MVCSYGSGGMHMFDHYLFDVERWGMWGRRLETWSVVRMLPLEYPEFFLGARRRQPPSDVPGDVQEPWFFPGSPIGKPYQLLGRDPDALLAMLGGDVCLRLMATPRFPRLQVQGAGHWVLVWERRRRMKPDAIADFLRDTEQFVAILSSRLARDLGSRRARRTHVAETHLFQG